MISVPKELSGYQLKFIQNLQIIEKENNIEKIPHWFWLSKQIYRLPKSFKDRKTILREILDLDHKIYCQKSKFHVNVDHDCICILCNKTMTRFHYRYCTAQQTQRSVA